MRQIAATIIAAALLSSCQSPARHEARDDAYCKSIGASGDMYAQCRMQQDANRQDRARRSAAMMIAGAQIMSTPQPRPMTTTTCRRYGQQVICNSF